MEAVRQSVLLVDDEPQVLVALEDLLGDDFKVLKTESPHQALEIVRDDDGIAVVISDQRMPKMGGDELLTKLSASSDARRILVTAFADLAAVIRAVNNGRIFAYVTKPWNPEDLRQKVRKAAEHYRMAQELTRERRLQDAILNSLNEGIIVADRAGKCLHFNPQAERILGAGPRDVDPNTWARHYGVFAADRSRLLAPGENPLIRAMRGEHSAETEVFVRNGAVPGATLSMAGTPLDDNGSNALGGLAVLRDITEQRELEAQLRQAQKMDAIGRLAGGVAHDFNNLLLVIQSYTSLVRDALPVDDSKREDLDEVLAASQRAAMLTRQLLAFSRKEVVQPTSLDLNEVVSRLEKMLGRIIGEDIELAVRLAPTLAAIRADAGQIEQVILNLSINARDAMPHGGRLTITTQNVTLDGETKHDQVNLGDFVLLTVSDDGVGMDADTQRRIFEPFFTTKDVGKGTGLGLATVYGIVQQSAGHIRVQSQVGRGTAFEVYFPRTRSALDRAVARAPSVAPPAVSGTILVVEDELAVRQIALRILRSRGHTVLEARSPSEARALCVEHGASIDLLLTDVVMPECSGVQLARELTQKYPRMQVVYMSGYPGGSAARKGALESDSEYIEKPFSPAVLVAKIEALLRRAAEPSRS